VTDLPQDHPENRKRCRICDRTDLAGSVDRDGTPYCWMDADMCSTCDERREVATAAAHQAVEAAAELLRYAREGNDLDGPFSIDVVEKLLDAAKMAAEIEGWPADQHERGRVYAAVAEFLEGWA
jgi:hypothetical protein